MRFNSLSIPNRRTGAVQSFRYAVDMDKLPAMATNVGLNWDDLRYFLRAAQAGTLAGAARAMGVEHSTIGRRLSALERSLGTPVMIRSPDGLHLTPLGEALVPLVQEADRAIQAVYNRATQQQSRVRLAIPTGLTKWFTVNLARLRAAHPQLTLELLTGSAVLDLKKGEADIAIRSGSISDEDLIARPLGSAGFSLYAAPSYLAHHPAPTNVDDLSGHQVIGYDLALAEVPASQWIEQRLAGATLALRSRELSEMLAAAISGVGLAVLPCMIADEESGLARITPNVLVSRPLWLVYPREARAIQPVQAVIGFVIDIMAENLSAITGDARGEI